MPQVVLRPIGLETNETFKTRFLQNSFLSTDAKITFQNGKFPNFILRVTAVPFSPWKPWPKQIRSQCSVCVKHNKVSDLETNDLIETLNWIKFGQGWRIDTQNFIDREFDSVLLSHITYQIIMMVEHWKYSNS